MTALQAALAGIGGAAGGYVQMEERKRRQQTEDEERKRRQALEEAGIRAEQRDILRTGGTQIAGMGEQVAGPVPSAIPLSGVGNAFAEAEKTAGPASSRGAMRQTVGGQTFMLPGAAETRAQGVQAAIDRAIAERGITSQFTAEDEQKAETKAFNALKRLGKVKGEFDPEYGQYGADLADERAIRRSRATQAGGAGETSEGKLRETFVTKYFSEYGELPKREQADEFVRLARGGRTIDDLFPADGAAQAAPATPPTRRAPMMAAPTGGMFLRDYLASTGANIPQAPVARSDKIFSLREKIRNLEKEKPYVGELGGTEEERRQWAPSALQLEQLRAALRQAERNQ
jgi:hypothetical protein